MKEELKNYLLEEEKHAFKGWDFSYLNGRWDNEPLPWSYKEIVKQYLHDTDNILDMGTGGGELLLSFNHPFEKTSVTEAYKPNIELCIKTLSPKGITVYPISQDDILYNVLSDAYDIVLNHHESYSDVEVKRVLKSSGIFITQQVGAYNNKDLATFIDETHVDQFPEITLEQSIKKLEAAGFEILYKSEYFPKIKFYDLGAVVYFAKIIEWEFINFSVLSCLDKLDQLNEKLEKQGYIESTEHRFMIVARKK